MELKKEKTKFLHLIRRSTIIAIYLLIITFLIKIAPNYIKEADDNRINLMVNNNNVTKNLKNDIIIKDNEYYLSAGDVKNFFDEFLYEDKNYIILTSNTKTAKYVKNSNKIDINTSEVDVTNPSIDVNNTTFLPMSELASIYNLEYKYDQNTNKLMVDSLSKKFVEAKSKSNQSIRYKADFFSKSIASIKKGETVSIVQDFNSNEDTELNGWVRVRTSSGIIGYVKKSSIKDRIVVRDNLTREKINGKVSIMWDYYSPYDPCPTRTDKIQGVNAVSPSFFELMSNGDIKTNIGDSGKKYVTWAKNNGYKVWPTLSNTFLNNKDAVSKMMSTFETREYLIENIVNSLIDADVDGINIDLENMYKEDKDKYSRFIIELAPRIRDLGMTLCVDVTEPDGSDTWSLCYDRHTLAETADYLVFIGYDQHNNSSKEAGTVAGYDWEEKNIKKFLGPQEGISSDKLILAMPFYTRLWKESNGKITSKVVNMKDVEIPSNVKVTWDDTTKQNYYEYEENGTTYKMWIEDETSISNKLNLVNQYNLAGAGFWEKDREKDGVWSIIKEKLQN